MQRVQRGEAGSGSQSLWQAEEAPKIRVCSISSPHRRPGYSRETKDAAVIAKVLTEDEARRIDDDERSS